MDINFSLLMPELIIAVSAFILIAISLMLPKGKKDVLGYLTMLVLVVSLGMLFKMIDIEDTLLHGNYLIDPLGTFLKIMIVIASILTILIGKDYVNRFLKDYFGEFCFLILFAVLGMMTLVSAGDFITLYIALELMTISFIVLVGLGKELKKASEAALKYILLSAFSSAVFLYGLTLVYGAAQTTKINLVIADLVSSNTLPVLALGIIFIICGLAFKISAVPFHMWTPDVYEGAPTPVTALLSVASKGAAFGVLLRLFLKTFGFNVPFWLPIIIALSLLSVVLGNFVAIPQKNIKRLLAYSSVAQAGYILLGLVAYSVTGLASSLFYLMFYVFGNLGAFGVVTAFSLGGGSEEIEGYNGLWKRAPFLAAVMLICLLSLAGIPPLLGFIGKFQLFKAVMEQGYLWLVIVSLGMSMVSVYYYLLIVKAMYLKDSNDESSVRTSFEMKFALSIILVVNLIIGIYPTPLTNIATFVAESFF